MKIFCKQAIFPQTKIFTQSKKICKNKDQKVSPKAMILDPFNNKSDAKIVLALQYLLLTKDHAY